MSNVLLTETNLRNLKFEAYLQKQVRLCRIVDHVVPPNEIKGILCRPETYGRFLRITKYQDTKIGNVIICEVEVYGSQGA